MHIVCLAKDRLPEQGQIAIFDRSWYERVPVERLEGFCSEADWRNRGKWEDYITAAEEILLKTSTPEAPWTLVEATDKYFSRIKSLHTVAEKLRWALK